MAELKIGMFGAWRGNSYTELFIKDEEVDVVAICDKNADRLSDDGKYKDIFTCADFDTFLKEGKKLGMNAVFLANYFNEHTPFAIKAMKAGMDVVSECTASSTLKECVELVECAEHTGRKYMLAENYPYMTMNLKMEQIIASGDLGSLLYAEGEYNHSCDTKHLMELTPGKYHWRAWMPRTYYVTHALGPIMFMTKSMPKYVSARAAHSGLLYEIKDFRRNYDGAGIMFCEMDNGMIARFTGCTAMASDYSRYRVCGDRASVEGGNNIGENKVRKFYFEHTKPENEEQISIIDASDVGKGNGGHGGGDGRVVHEIKKYFLDGERPFFDVYRAVTMSAVAILGWRSCLNHGENFKIPDFTDITDRNTVRDDDLTPFPDADGNGVTLPCAIPFEK